VIPPPWLRSTSTVVNLFGYQLEANYIESKVSAAEAFVNELFNTVGGSVPGGWNAGCRPPAK
jgi:hypothetical protein